MKEILSTWLLFQLMLGLALLVVPITLTGAGSLTITVPVYVAMVVLTLARESLRAKRLRRASEIRTFVVLVSDLLTLTGGSHGGTHWAILRDLRKDTQFQAQMDLCGNHQAGKLLDDRCQRLFADVVDLSGRVHKMDASTPDESLKDAMSGFGQRLQEYRLVIQEFLGFLQDTKGKSQTIQERVPFSPRIHRDLADGYDRMMDSARQARAELRAYAGHDWLPDDRLTRFPRAALLG